MGRSSAPRSTLSSTAPTRTPSTSACRNRGPVIAEWRHRLIFDPLTRGVDPETDAIDYQRTSLGLGLYIVHEIATAHGGSVTVTSNEVDGTTFRVELPRHLPTESIQTG